VITDRLGYRLRVGVVVPAFNTSVQPEFEAMRPPGVTNHVSRIMMPDGNLESDSDQVAVIRSLGPDLVPAIKRVILARPGIVVMGISIPTFWNGLAGMRLMKAELETAAGVPVVLGAEACLAALEMMASGRRIGVLTPYQPIGDEKVANFFSEAGYTVTAIRSMQPPRGSAIADTPVEMIQEGFQTLARSGCDTLVQVGTNLALADIVESESLRLGKPILSINTATYWLALRRAGIADTIPGFGAPLNL
jgi:maleate isomerase